MLNFPVDNLAYSDSPEREQEIWRKKGHSQQQQDRKEGWKEWRKEGRKEGWMERNGFLMSSQPWWLYQGKPTMNETKWQKEQKNKDPKTPLEWSTRISIDWILTCNQPHTGPAQNELGQKQIPIWKLLTPCLSQFYKMNPDTIHNTKHTCRHKCSMC